jgi:hypothetical protein
MPFSFSIASYERSTVSSYIDINELIDEIATNARSASDAWTLGRDAGVRIKRDSFNPSVVADLTAREEGLEAAIQQSRQIQAADVASFAGSTTSGSSSSTSGGFWSGLLNLFPIASGIADLFGFGSGPSPVLPPAKYLHPESINFEAATSSGGTSLVPLSYGSDGLPRIATGREPANESVEAFARDSWQAVPIEQATASNILAEIETLTQATPIVTAGASSRMADNNPVSAAGMNLVNYPLFAERLEGIGFTPTSGMDGQDLTGPPSLVGRTARSSPDLGETTNARNDQQNGNVSPNILVQVQAMDSQSFMDHSQDIAQAVRQAMLNMNTLNDVILDL